MDGNVQGLTRGRQVAINPVAQLKHKTLLHELAEGILHASESDFAETDKTSRILRGVEVEAVARLCCDHWKWKRADYCRGYLRTGSTKG